ncbi:GNAT family N-acetyltransferase [Undibacterium sp. Ji22W]|uniref:GNAT family N-acetyltransferase n=1 Tax=Undibacterium sp. Ji22W TaxID=3413038 RepID=UPI003BF28568
MTQQLDNIFWYSLSGAQACFAAGTGSARRYAKGFSPILGFADAQNPDFSLLENDCEPGEHFYVGGWTGAVPAGWQIDAESSMYRMVWNGVMPAEDGAFQPRRLQQADAEQAVALARLTNPGPFGLRTIELGEYLGCFDGESSGEHSSERLIAMAGERSFAPPYREVSGVCTHPDFQGRGLAKRLMHKIIRRQLLAQEIPFLHVMSSNTAAHELYLRMGFRDYCETPVRVVYRVDSNLA